MKIRSVVAVFCFFSLTGCVSIKTDVQKSSNVATNITKICSLDEVKQLSSPKDILDGFKKDLIADFGLSSDPQDAPDKTNIQQTLDDLRSQFAKLKDEDQQKLSNVKTAINTLKTDVTALRTDVENQFAAWKKDDEAECKSSPVACVIPTVLIIQQLAQTMQADAATFREDLNSTRATVQADLKAILTDNSSSATAIAMDNDFHRLETMATVLKHVVDTVISLVDNSPSNDPVAQALEDTIKTRFDDYVAYESAYVTENVATQIARDSVAKIDSLNGQAWYIGAILGGFVTLGIYDDARIEIQKFATDARDTKMAGKFKAAYYQALVAQSCTRLTQNSSSADTNSTRAQLLLTPIHIILICGDNALDPSGSGKITSCTANPTATSGATTVAVTDQAPASNVVKANLQNAASDKTSSQAAHKTAGIFSKVYVQSECQTEGSANVATGACPPSTAAPRTKFLLAYETIKLQTDSDKPAPKPELPKYKRVEDKTVQDVTSHFQFPTSPVEATVH
jgi:hypothetical protein